ncbi:uncharacterized protein [Triticum aestivum]|uniref:uncharacterized protein n=1 Tax=Triticum aestivum TaxID=4565 RepID=UPI001D002A99|nr:uncharacterized protein LOC123108257 [Triticum aestivum]
MAGQEGKVLDAPTSPPPTETMAGQDAPKSPAPAGGDTGRDHLKLPLATDQDPDATVPQVGSGDEEQETLVRGKKKNVDDPSGSDASGSTKKHRTADLSHAATVEGAATSTGLAPSPPRPFLPTPSFLTSRFLQQQASDRHHAGRPEVSRRRPGQQYSLDP